jgi:hypothetical protein
MIKVPGRQLPLFSRFRARFLKNLMEAATEELGECDRPLVLYK